MKGSFRIGDWVVHPPHNLLVKESEEIHIEPRAMQLLAYLAEHPNEVVDKETIIQEVWEGAFVTDEALTNCIYNLRKALGDDAKKPAFIQTVPQRGYRLIAPVTKVAIEPEEALSPYPGLRPFSEEDADFFYGREEEVQALWTKLKRNHLIGLIGPSGAGKSSFLRAGLIPAKPEGWSAVVCHPGERPFVSLAQALAPAMVGNLEAIKELLRFEELETAVSVLKRWNDTNEEVLLIVDQFEELFTLNPPEVHSSVAELVGRASEQASVHVLISIRDDFLIQCNYHSALKAVFSDLTPLTVLTGDGLRRALVEPAVKCGYRFEDDPLVDEMLTEVADERGALPLLAFAASRLWEKRDREQKLLTRNAYLEIGGVSGAIAQNAEATMERIGREGQPIVREMFRNLTTAKGTRATRDREELLSVFEDQENANTVLGELIDARLLTAFEMPVTAEGSEEGQHVEIIHESLLTSWPRLVRWQTQDADGAQLRDQLRQAAQLWDSRGRPTELLWTGASYLEFRAWRERYSGGLTALEEAYARAMTEHAGRRRKRRRVVVATAFIVLLGVLGVIGQLWRQSVREARRAEASKLFALGQLEIGENPSSAVAYSLASLELADKTEVRLFAHEALWRGPTALKLPMSTWPLAMAFSPDGRWLAVGDNEGSVHLWPQEGGTPRVLRGHHGRIGHVVFGPSSDVLVSWGAEKKELRLWSVPEGRQTQTMDGLSSFWLREGSHVLITVKPTTEDGRRFHFWRLDGRELTSLGSWEEEGVSQCDLDPTARRFAYAKGGDIYLTPFEDLGTKPATRLGRHDGPVRRLRFTPDGERLASLDISGEIRIWLLAAGPPNPLHIFRGKEDSDAWRFNPTGSWLATSYPSGDIWVWAMASDSPEPLRVFKEQPDAMDFHFDPSGSWLACASSDGTARLWDLEGRPSADPLTLGLAGQMLSLTFHPSGKWLATGNQFGAAIWPLDRPYSRIFRGHEEVVTRLRFAPDGSFLASVSWDGTVRVWPLTSPGDVGRVLFRNEETVPDELWGLDVDPGGRNLVTSGIEKIWVLPLTGGPPRGLKGYGGEVASVAFGPEGRLVAAGPGFWNEGDEVIRIWDLESGEVRVLDAGDGTLHLDLAFTPDGRLLSAGDGGLRLWNLGDGSHQLIRKAEKPRVIGHFDMTRDGRRVVSVDGEWGNSQVVPRIVLHDLEEGTSQELATQGRYVALDPTGTIVVAGDMDGVIRVGKVNGEEPHLLLGHKVGVACVTVHSNGRWIASAGEDGTIRLWPMPDMDKRPFHTLPCDDLIDRLRALTNLRAVPDRDSPTGYKIEAGPFPGWTKVPTW